jgi:hypothetical protein
MGEREQCGHRHGQTQSAERQSRLPVAHAEHPYLLHVTGGGKPPAVAPPAAPVKRRTGAYRAPGPPQVPGNITSAPPHRVRTLCTVMRCVNSSS